MCVAIVSAIAFSDALPNKATVERLIGHEEEEGEGEGEGREELDERTLSFLPLGVLNEQSLVLPILTQSVSHSHTRSTGYTPVFNHAFWVVLIMRHLASCLV